MGIALWTLQTGKAPLSKLTGLVGTKLTVWIWTEQYNKVYFPSVSFGVSYVCYLEYMIVLSYLALTKNHCIICAYNTDHKAEKQ